MSISATAVAFLVIIGCNGSPETYTGQDCPAEINAESWVSVNGSDPKEECEALIHGKLFDPTYYMTGYDYYAVRCER